MSNTWTYEQLPAATSVTELAQLVNRRLQALDNALRKKAGTARAGDTTPSVLNLDVLTTANTGATSITTFTQGHVGKLVTLIAGDANTTLVQGTNLKLISGANVVLANGDVRSFVTADGVVWREVR